MSLTGSTFFDTLVLLTVLLFAAVVMVWPKLGGRGPQSVAARIGLLLALNTLVLFTAAVNLNDSYLFFASWSDLRSAFTGRLTQVQLDRGAPAAVAYRAKAQGAAATAPAFLRHLSPSRFNHAGVATFRVTGRTSGITSQVMVQLPRGYFAPANRHRHYPVIETFMGYPGSLGQWIGTMNLGGVLSGLVNQGRIGPAIVVSPQSQIPGGVDTECVNGSSGNPQVETWLTKDVPTWVARTFRVRTDRASWAAVGFSAGGWCAAMASMLHPAQYGGAIVMAGYFRPEMGPFYQPYPSSSPLNKRYDLVALAHDRPPPVAMWVQTSHADHVSFSGSAAFLNAARPPLSVHAVVLRQAGHRVQVWQALLPEALRWLGTTLPGFRASPPHQTHAPVLSVGGRVAQRRGVPRTRGARSTAWSRAHPHRRGTYAGRGRP